MPYTYKERKVSSLALHVTLSSIGACPEEDVIEKKCFMTTNLEFLFD
jgi:2'-5' RNA ligase